MGEKKKREDRDEGEGKERGGGDQRESTGRVGTPRETGEERRVREHLSFSVCHVFAAGKKSVSHSSPLLQVQHIASRWTGGMR